MIAFDSTSQWSSGSSWTHTTSGSDRLLVVSCFGDLTDTLTSVTYNGVSMTLLSKALTPADRYNYLFYLLNPALGANTVQINGPSVIRGVSASYTGVAQTGQPDSNPTPTTGTGTQASVNITPGASGCWLIGNPAGGAGYNNAGAGYTIRGTTSGGTILQDSNGPVSPGSPIAFVSDTTSIQAWSIRVASFAPAVTVVKSGMFGQLLELA